MPGAPRRQGGRWVAQTRCAGRLRSSASRRWAFPLVATPRPAPLSMCHGAGRCRLVGARAPRPAEAGTMRLAGRRDCSAPHCVGGGPDFGDARRRTLGRSCAASTLDLARGADGTLIGHGSMGDGAQQSVGDPCCGSVASVQLGVPGPRRSRCEPAYRCVAQGREDVAVEQVAVLGQRRLSEPSVLGRPLLGVVSDLRK